MSVPWYEMDENGVGHEVFEAPEPDGETREEYAAKYPEHASESYLDIIFPPEDDERDDDEP